MNDTEDRSIERVRNRFLNRKGTTCTQEDKDAFFAELNSLPNTRQYLAKLIAKLIAPVQWESPCYDWLTKEQLKILQHRLDTGDYVKTQFQKGGNQNKYVNIKVNKY